MISVKDFKTGSRRNKEVDITLSILERDLGDVEFKFSEFPKIIGNIYKDSSDICAYFDVELFIKENCSRCLKDMIVHENISVSGLLANDEIMQENEDVILMQDDMLDMEHILDMALIDYAPFKLLCKSDCKGLCKDCGVDLNTETCKCNIVDENIDPRMEVLKGLLKNNEGGARNGSTKEKNS